MTKCKSYHHGDLRNALIMAAVELIEESGAAEFTMADAARRAGVSAAAPYRHFRDRNELREAVSYLYFIGLGEATEATREAWPEGSREAIIALGQMYAAMCYHGGASTTWPGPGSSIPGPRRTGRQIARALTPSSALWRPGVPTGASCGPTRWTWLLNCGDWRTAWRC